MDWKQAAKRLAELFPCDRLHPEVSAWLSGRTGAAKGPWALGLSGGADSVFLLLLLAVRSREEGRTLIALHFDHGLRGRESDQDRTFCVKLCRSLGIPLVTDKWRRMPKRAQVSEAEAREARMAFFAAAMAKHGSRALFLGHQLEDLAETMLMRLARGSGAAGLAAPRPVQALPGGQFRLRPLLSITRTQLRDALREAGATWREDSSNKGGHYLRNRIRHDVLPNWLAAASHGRDALAGAALSRSLLQEDDEALETWLDSCRALGPGARLKLAPLSDKPKALWRRALHRWLAKTPYRGDLSRQGFALLLEACRKGSPTRQSLGKEGFAVIRAGVLTFRKTQGSR